MTRWTLGLAVACVLMLATHVHPNFVRVRHRVVTTPVVATQPVLRVELPDLSDLAGAPAAVIVRITSEEAIRVRLAIGSLELMTASVGAGRSQRLDAAGLLPPGGGHSLTIEGDRAGWELEFLEVANVHGYSAGTLGFVVVPGLSRGTPHVPLWLTVLAGALLVVAGRWLVLPASRRWALAYRAAAAFVLVSYALVLVADRVTPFLVLLSTSAFVATAAVLYAPVLVRIVRVMRASAGLRPFVPFLPHGIVAVLVLSGVAGFYSADTGFTSLIMFGQEFEPQSVPALKAIPHAVETPSGYDGQFYAQIALDPLLRDPATAGALDRPGYRARRVLGPAIAHVLGLGQPAWVLQVYALLNVLCWLPLAWLLVRWLPPGSVPATAAWCACVLSHGLMASMRLSLTDGPSALLIALGIRALEAGRPWTSAAVLGVSGLARETNLIAGVALPPPDGRRLPAWVGRAMIVVLPLALWIGVLVWRGLPVAGGGPRDFSMPLSAYAGKWVASLTHLSTSGGDRLAWSSVLTLIALTTQLGALVWWRDWHNPWWRVGAGYGALMLVVGAAVWEGDPGAVTRVLLPMTLAFNIQLPGRPAFWTLWLAGNANLAFGPAELGWLL